MKKFELTSEFITNVLGTKLFRIKALIEFGDVSAGELGGYIEKEENLAQDGNAWVYGNAKVYGDAWVYGNAKVYGDAWVYGDAEVCGDADYSTVKGFGGCFYGTLEEFRKKVKETHGESKTAKEYLMLADLMEYKFSREMDEEVNQ